MRASRRRERLFVADPVNPLPPRPARLRTWLRETGVVLLLVAVALWLTDPWIRNPAGSVLGLQDAKTGELSVDCMQTMTFGGWIDFSALKLKLWPLAYTDYLMYPRGASWGDSFDSLLFSMVTAALGAVLPLPVAYSLSVVLTFFMTGWVMWRLGARLWGAGAVALTIALASMMSPFLMQRYLCHPNLLYIWAIPAAVLAFDRWRERPDWRGTLAWALSFPLMALASWYVLIAGFVFQVGATMAVLGHRLARDPAVGRRHLATLPAAWLLGMALVVLIASPMFDSLDRRRQVDQRELLGFSTPLAQYLMPAPNSRAGNLPLIHGLQKTMKTHWEAVATVPLVLALLAAGWMFGRGRSVMKTALILTVAGGVVASLGPYLQVGHALATPRHAIRLPIHYLVKLWPGAGLIHVPGRVHNVVFFAVAVGAGFALNGVVGRLRGRLRGIVATGVLLAGLLVFCGWWALPRYPQRLAPLPEVPAFYRELGARPGRGAVFDVPYSSYWFPHYNFYQYAHGRPEVTSVLYHDAISPWSFDYLWGRGDLVQFMQNDKLSRDPELIGRIARPDYLDRLGGEGIDYVVVHPRFLEFLIGEKFMQPEARDLYARVEARWRPRLVYADDRIRAYRTAP